MLVYRVESVAGKGCYIGGGPGHDAARYEHTDGMELYQKYHPNPNIDSRLSEWWNGPRSINCHKYYFGFESMESLTEWFPKNKWHWFENDSDNWVIALYESNDVIIRTTQLVFNRNEAQFIKWAHTFEREGVPFNIIRPEAII